MSVKGIYFNGRWLAHPGAYSRVDAENMVSKIGLGGKVVVMIGECTGGKPEEVLWFNNPSAAKKVLKSGELLDAMELAWSPTPEGEGADVIGALRVNSATKSSFILKDINKSDSMKADSKDWGEDTKYIQIKLENGTKIGTKKVTVYDVLTETYEFFDNLGELFTIKYSGEEPYIRLSVEANELDGKAQTIRIKKGADEATAQDDIIINLTQQNYSDIRNIVNFINSHENYDAEFIAGVDYTMFSSRELDTLTDVNIKGESPSLITAVRADIAKEISKSSIFVDFSVINWDSGVPENFSYTPLVGGSEGTVPNSWSDLFDKLGSIELDEVVPITSDASIHAECKEHVNFASTNLRRERRMTCGGSAGEDVEQVKTRAQAFNSSRVQLAYPGIKKHKHGELVTLPPYVAAGMYAGRHAFKDYGDSCTFDLFDVVSLEKDLTPLEINELLQAGVATLEFVQNEGVRLVQDITTCVTSVDPLYVERCVGEYADYLSRLMRKTLETRFVGKGGTKARVTSIKNTVISILEDEKNNYENIVEYKNVRVAIEGRVVTVEYEVAPTEPINFILITSHFYIPSFEV